MSGHLSVCVGCTRATWDNIVKVGECMYPMPPFVRVFKQIYPDAARTDFTFCPVREPLQEEP